MNAEINLPKVASTALIVVDMQNGFLHVDGSCSKAGFPVQALSGSVAPCARLIEAARRAGVPIVFTRYTYRSDFKDGGFMLREKFPMLAEASALVAGTWDQALIAELNAQPTDFIIDKNRPSSFHGTPLESYLKGLGVEELVVCGVTTNCCVETTVRDAAQRDFRTFVVVDAVAEWDAARNQSALDSMSILFAHPVTVEQVIKTWC